MSDRWPSAPKSSPGSITAAAAVAAGIVGILAGVGGGSGPLPAAAATIIVVLGVRRDSRGLLALGALWLVGTAVGNGVTPGPVAAVPAAVGAGLLAWDFGTTSLDLRSQFAPAAATGRLEWLHVTVSTGVVGLGVALAIAGSRLIGPVGSAGATFLLVAIVGLLVALNQIR